ncbi:ribosome-associated translation inhibitor RaiA [Polaribacter haliotis]|uniref:Ribosome-associated translation inhibitor RaiA n=1 Tax=Polaribacter haliotis TaxID=1888915 RepID=A0A7L8AHA1_9FLAO|nr:ribosome-associated translation inhibitor RaiA [Polaribacter haliotis]QOD61378.1 ribosome-associated translation inhibitor RaiA [Polaribacter haliotis]
MDIKFEYHDITASERLEAFTTEKLNHMYKKYDFLIRADVFFKQENTSSEETGKICGIRVSLPGPRLFAESSNDNFESSVSEAIRELDVQLRKKKDKMKAY